MNSGPLTTAGPRCGHSAASATETKFSSSRLANAKSCTESAHGAPPRWTEICASMAEPIAAFAFCTSSQVTLPS